MESFMTPSSRVPTKKTIWSRPDPEMALAPSIAAQPLGEGVEGVSRVFDRVRPHGPQTAPETRESSPCPLLVVGEGEEGGERVGDGERADIVLQDQQHIEAISIKYRIRIPKEKTGRDVLEGSAVLAIPVLACRGIRGIGQEEGVRLPIEKPGHRGQNRKRSRDQRQSSADLMIKRYSFEGQVAQEEHRPFSHSVFCLIYAARVMRYEYI